MGTPRILGFVIAFVLMSFFIGIFGLFLSSLSTNYDVGYDSGHLDVYNKSRIMAERAELYQKSITNIKEEREERGILDIIGGFFSSAYNSLLVISDSYNIFYSILNNAMDDMTQAGLGTVAGYLRIMISTLVILLIFIGIVMAIVLKREKL